GIYLGDYIFWDDERQTEFVRDNFGWREDNVEGTYKRYKSVECKMAGVHDYSKFVKRGFGRGTDHASQDVRVGLLTREEGFELAKKHDTERPGALDEYLRITGYTEKEFEKILKGKREGKAKKLP
ncbi:MAG: N-acetyl sugar amidotransferase, partial [Candidatus Omnitrophica bacterium]|nr:N-acetyl sugar amidotransferase [Candidatus Omnitrophota bacterium]